MVGGMTGYSQFDASLWILGGNGSMCWDTDCSILRTCSRTKLHHILDAFLLGGYWCGGRQFCMVEKIVWSVAILAEELALAYGRLQMW